jgi:hypothetical protein
VINNVSSIGITYLGIYGGQYSVGSQASADTELPPAKGFVVNILASVAQARQLSETGTRSTVPSFHVLGSHLPIRVYQQVSYD